MVFDTQIKRKLKLYGSNGLSWPITASGFCRTRIRLGNLFFRIRINLCRIFPRKIQDKFRWYIRRNLVIILNLLSMSFKHILIIHLNSIEKNSLFKSNDLVSWDRIWRVKCVSNKACLSHLVTKKSKYLQEWTRKRIVKKSYVVRQVLL